MSSSSPLIDLPRDDTHSAGAGSNPDLYDPSVPLRPQVVGDGGSGAGDVADLRSGEAVTVYRGRSRLQRWLNVGCARGQRWVVLQPPQPPLYASVGRVAVRDGLLGMAVGGGGGAGGGGQRAGP